MSLHAAQIESKDAGARPHSAAELRAELDAALERVERDEKDAAAWRDVGRIRTLLRIDNDAVTAFERALDLEHDLKPSLWLALAIAATRAARYDAVLRAFEALTRLEPREPSFWIFRSMALDNLGRGDEAAGALRRAASLDAEPGNRVAIAFALGLLGRYDEALALDEQAIQDDEANPWAWANKGLHLAKTAEAIRDPAKRAEAIDAVRRAFERAVAAAPSDATILRNYGVALGGLELYEDARGRLEEALAKNPNDVATLRSLGFVLTELEEDESALVKDTEAVELAPRHPIAWRSKGVDLFRLKRYEEALHAFTRATELAPGGPEMWHAKGSALWKLAQYEEAADAFRRATASQASPDACFGLAASLDALGRHTEALDALRQAVGLAPELRQLWAMLGRTYRKLGNAQAAEHAFRRGFKLEPSVEMASGVVDALAAQGAENKALEFLANEARDLDQAELAYLRGVLLTRLGREDEAMAELTVAARLWRAEDVRDARAIAVAKALETYRGPRGAAASWSEHWFGPSTDARTRTLGVLLLAGLLAALAVPLAAPGELAPLKYGAGWAAITLPVTVLVLLLALPTVQTIKAGGGSFEITTIVLPHLDQLALALPSEIPIDKIADLPSLDARAVGLSDLLPSVLESGSPDVEAAQHRPREAAQ
jgi:tetratricopeptide (TPR) repeat protein